MKCKEPHPEFDHVSPGQNMVIIQWNLNDSKSPQITRNLLSILANLNNAVVRIVSILSLIPNFSNLFSKLLGTVLRVSTIIGITFTLLYQSFFQFSGKVQIFVYLLAALSTSPNDWDCKIIIIHLKIIGVRTM